MQVLCYPVGEMAANCYFLIDDLTNDCFIIDPGDDAEFLSTEILSRHLKPKAILLTHAHFDHLLATLELSLNFSLPVYLHPKDHFLYQKAFSSARHFQPQGSTLRPPTTTQPLSDHQRLKLGQEQVEVLHTPGHTPGSVCFYFKSHLFTGDTLFAEGPGRADRSYSSPQDLKTSLKQLYNLPSDTLVYPGHQESGFTLGQLHLS